MAQAEQDREEQDKTRRIFESFLRDIPPSPADAVRRGLVETNFDVSLHATVKAAIDDNTWGETVTTAAIVPIDYGVPVPTLALGELAEALKDAVGDANPRFIVGKMAVGDGGGDLVAIHHIYAADVRDACDAKSDAPEILSAAREFAL